MPRTVCSRRGLTLVEVLVVVGVVALLAGLLLAVLPGVRARGQEAACLSNTRGIGTLFAAHAADHRHHWPLAGAVVLPDDTSGYGSLPAAVGDRTRARYAYLRADPLSNSVPTQEYLLPPSSALDKDDVVDAAAWTCPSRVARTGPVPFQIGLRIRIDYLRTPPPKALGYAVNGGVLGFDYRNLGSPRRLAGNSVRVRDASRLVLAGDAGDPQDVPAQFNVWTPVLGSGSGSDAGPVTLADLGVTGLGLAGLMEPSPVVATDRHGRGATLVFADGHAETTPPGRLGQAVLATR